MQMQHNLLVTDCYGVDPAMRHILGQCSCSAWFEIVMDTKNMFNVIDMMMGPEFAASVTQANFPPCPAVLGLTRHFEKELKHAV